MSIIDDVTNHDDVISILFPLRLLILHLGLAAMTLCMTLAWTTLRRSTRQGGCLDRPAVARQTSSLAERGEMVYMIECRTQMKKLMF